MTIPFTENERRAVLLYAGCPVPGAEDDYYCMENAYRALNLLMMEGQAGERVRICAEGQRPNSVSIRRWDKTLAVLEDLFEALCKYSVNQAAAGRPLPDPLVRGDRKVNFELMRAAGATVAFTSTARDALVADFLKGKQEPHVLHITLGDRVPYLDLADFLGSDYTLDEREVLLPPMIRMACGPCRTEDCPGIGPVRHYDITFTGFTEGSESLDEEAAAAFLEENAVCAADGLWNLVKKKLDADVFADEDHIYWKWKAAFRRLTMLRMQRIYRRYFGGN